VLLKCYYPQWSRDRIFLRLRSLGIPWKECEELLRHFRTAILDGALPLDSYDPQTLAGIVRALNNPRDTSLIDKTVSQVFVDFATGEDSPSNNITINILRNIREATDFSHPAEWFPEARSIRRRIIMHVGPTNSGKTHQALQALAAAKTGYYAGPLRLLAHEIWERLNRGQIVPAGVTLDPSAAADDNGGMDLLDGSVPTKPPVLTKEHNKRFARACNLITGEEQRIVAEDALVSCTVEMLQFNRFVDIAVVDEIQMIADPTRGSGWTSAVLGLCAKEIHLCGEETAVETVKNLVKETGDELIVNRYQRLTPLRVANRSLHGDLKRIEKGDCVVSFSRSGIFALKKKIEDITNLRCAVAYGRLPPEIRSEQAALFNDPNSGFDVIVGSDAIGMGLNLYVSDTRPFRTHHSHSHRKIKRIVFESSRKWDGTKEIDLSTSQIKQIGGRAGRYGLHGDSSDGGIVTTLYPEDLPAVKAAMDSALPPIPGAILPINSDAYNTVKQATLADKPRFASVVEIISLFSRTRHPYICSENREHRRIAEFLNTASDHFTMEDTMHWFYSPVSWRDDVAKAVATRFLKDHQMRLRVDLTKALRQEKLLKALETTWSAIETQTKVSNPREILMALETLHKSIVLYMWMGQRMPIVFADLKEASELKMKVEKAMEFVLRAITKGVSAKKIVSRLPGGRS
jgi:ATP-dependent RNA helicase SUPV3L1/SUV3